MTSKNPIVKNYAGGLPAPRAFYRLRPYTCAMHRQCRQFDKDKEKIIVASIGGISRAAGSTAARLRLPEEAEAVRQVDSDGTSLRALSGRRAGQAGAARSARRPGLLPRQDI